MVGRRRCALLLVTLCAVTRVHAQERPSLPAFSEDWPQGKVRPFVGFSAAAGALTRTDLTLGYGKPHWVFVGVEGGAASNADMARTDVRARLALLYADLTIGWGKVWSYRHSLLPQQAEQRSLRAAGFDGARYQTLQMLLAGLAPAPFGYVDYQVEALHILGVPRGVALYEESLRAVVHPSWALVGRLGYGYVFSDKRGAIGVLAEGIWPGARGDYIARVGPLFSWAFSPRIDLALTLTTVVHSPDSLNVYHNLWGNVRARYRTASR